MPLLCIRLERIIAVLHSALRWIAAARRLTAFASRLGCQIWIPGKRAILGRDALAALAPGFGGEFTILGEAALLVRHGHAAFRGDFTLPILIH